MANWKRLDGLRGQDRQTDYGDQTSVRESAEIGEDVSEETCNEVVQVWTSETTVWTTRSGQTLWRHDTYSTMDDQISTLTNDPYVSMVD